MNRSRPFTWIASAIFALMAIVHAIRLVKHFQIVVGSHQIPIWASWVGLIVAGGLSWMLCREARGTSGA
jgi:hypothetical protein